MESIKLWTIKEMAAKTGLSYTTIRREIEDGKIKAVKVRSQRRITFQEVRRYYQEVTGELIDCECGK